MPRLLPIAIVILHAALSHAAATLPAGSDAAREAFALCFAADGLPHAERMAILKRGHDRAEEAVLADPDDALAHFAVFCNLGKRLDTEGVSLHTLGDLRHARAALETALTLQPDFPDALAAKGALLFRLPRLLGGDRAQAQRLLQRAVALDPANDRARAILAEVLDANGEADETPAHAGTVGTLLDGGDRAP